MVHVARFSIGLEAIRYIQCIAMMAASRLDATAVDLHYRLEDSSQ